MGQRFFHPFPEPDIVADWMIAKCLAAQADVTKEEDVEKAVAAAVKEFGGIDYAA
jgi:NAD(P)-dependent dehydrogenase (short-subunit alcohol dehydrogenase family)